VWVRPIPVRPVVVPLDRFLVVPVWYSSFRWLLCFHFHSWCLINYQPHCQSLVLLPVFHIFLNTLSCLYFIHFLCSKIQTFNEVSFTHTEAHQVCYKVSSFLCLVNNLLFYKKHWAKTSTSRFKWICWNLASGFNVHQVKKYFYRLVCMINLQLAR